MSDAYNKELRKMALSVGAEIGCAENLHEGVYCATGGPNYETVAECNFLQRLGADAVGQSRGRVKGKSLYVMRAGVLAAAAEVWLVCSSFPFAKHCAIPAQYGTQGKVSSV